MANRLVVRFHLTDSLVDWLVLANCLINGFVALNLLIDGLVTDLWARAAALENVTIVMVRFVMFVVMRVRSHGEEYI